MDITKYRGEVQLFNPFHKGKGKGGGQFTSKVHSAGSAVSGAIKSESGKNVARGFATKSFTSTAVAAASFLIGRKVGGILAAANLLVGTAQLADAIERRSFEKENIREYQKGKGESAHYVLTAKRNKRAAEIQIGKSAAKVMANAILLGIAVKGMGSDKKKEMSEPDNKKREVIAMIYKIAKDAIADKVDELTVGGMTFTREQLQDFVDGVDGAS